MILLWLFLSLAFFVLVWLGFWIAVTKVVEHSSRQTDFAKGTLPFSRRMVFIKVRFTFLAINKLPGLASLLIRQIETGSIFSLRKALRF